MLEDVDVDDDEDVAETDGQLKRVLRNWDWAVAAVGPGLTEALEKNQKQKERDKKKRAAQRKKEQKQQDEQAALEAVKLLEQQRLDEVNRQEQMKKDAGKCAACGKALWGQVAIDVLGLRCCNSVCVLRVRRSLAAEAALKRQPT